MGEKAAVILECTVAMTLSSELEGGALAHIRGSEVQREGRMGQRRDVKVDALVGERWWARDTKAEDIVGLGLGCDVGFVCWRYKGNGAPLC